MCVCTNFHKLKRQSGSFLYAVLNQSIYIFFFLPIQINTTRLAITHILECIPGLTQTMNYTKKQKEAILNYLRLERAKVAKRNEMAKKKLADQTFQKVLRRLNGVSVTLWDIKLKDIFQVERSKKLVAKNLVRDVQDMRRKLILDQKKSPVKTTKTSSR